MGVITTKAIVLSAIKYSETSLIVKCYTAEQGLQTYMVRGVLKAKKKGIKAAYFQLLTQLSLVSTTSVKSTLHTIKEVQIIHPYKHIYKDVVKQSVVLFLSEVLSKSIQEEEQNTHFYNYLEASLTWLDLHDNVSNYHLLFLLNTTRFLGFYPDLSDSNLPNFDLLNGCFTKERSLKHSIFGNNLYQFKKLFGINLDTLSTVSYSKNERQQVLQIILTYFELHLGGFSKPKSLQVLEAVFS